MMCRIRNKGFLLFFGSLLSFAINKVATAVDCQPTIERDVAIVGGGLAGSFASSVLDLAGVSYVLIEADNVLGGRLRSFESPFNFDLSAEPVTLEAGANFMYGLGNNFGINPIYGLFNEYNVDFYIQPLDDQDVFRRNGGRYPGNKVRKERRRMKQFVRKCLDRAGKDWFDEYVNGGTTTPDESAKRVLKNCDFKGGWKATSRLRRAMAYVYIETENLLEIKELGKASFPEDSFEQFDDERVFFQKDQNGGTTSMMDAFAADHLTNGLIHMDTTVTSIDTTGSPAQLEATRWPGTASECTQRYEASYAIVTMPQNVLIDEQANMFEPDLIIDNHPVKQNFAEKVWFQWDSPWWDKSKQWIVVANDQEDGKGTFWLNYNHPDCLPGSNLLMSFVTEKQLDDMGGTVDPDMLEAGLSNLPGYYPSDRSFKTDWENNVFFRGGWEIWELGKTYEEFDAATQPQGNLHLAGAAHCRNFYGFTWGAIFSGIYNAEWVVARLGGDSLEDARPAFSPCLDDDDIRRGEWRDFYAPYDWFEVPQDTRKV